MNEPCSHPWKVRRLSNGRRLAPPLPRTPARGRNPSPSKSHLRESALYNAARLVYLGGAVSYIRQGIGGFERDYLSVSGDTPADTGLWQDLRVAIHRATRLALDRPDATTIIAEQHNLNPDDLQPCHILRPLKRVVHGADVAPPEQLIAIQSPITDGLESNGSFHDHDRRLLLQVPSIVQAIDSSKFERVFACFANINRRRRRNTLKAGDDAMFYDHGSG
ncbi:hypothetical protein BP5796_03096 [Coleophoma crateriformis]|uniref:Uncharacterized protein n=1 Tax=Coleophoma crateriformis TaxID=565419 RepID=A0A3D8SMA5_9HELO|nr:hypothetical protein BP5796_03096 [Coleophoma crateriformis]